MPLESFETIGALLPEVMGQSLTGMRLGGTDCVLWGCKSETELRAWLLGHINPSATDEEMCRLLISSHNVVVSLRTEGRFPPGGTFHYVAVGCDVRPQADGWNHEGALADLRAALTGPTIEQCEEWLVLLQAATARRPDSEMTGVVALTLYAAHLAQYPADVARDACTSLARGSGKVVWFPTLSELIAVCERLVAPRRVMIDALQCFGARVARRADKSETDKARVREMVAVFRAQQAVSEAAKPKPSFAFKAQGATDQTGITSTLRDLVRRQRGEPLIPVRQPAVAEDEREAI